MITRIKTRLCILAIVFAACIGFFGPTNGMQKGEKRIKDPNKYHLLCTGDMHCVQSYFFGSGSVGSEQMLASSQGKHIWDISPISQLHWTEKKKLKESIASACRGNTKMVCQLIVSKEFQSFIIDASIKPVKCHNSSIDFLIKYSIIFSNRSLKVPGRSIESEESSEEGHELGRALRDLPGSRGQSCDYEQQSGDDQEARPSFGFTKTSSNGAIPISNRKELSSDEEYQDDGQEARLPFGFSFGCESDNDQ